MNVGIKDLRDRITSVGNTKKITDAMKLVAAAKVRRAQEAVIAGRPFAENLVKVSKIAVIEIGKDNALNHVISR